MKAAKFFQILYYIILILILLWVTAGALGWKEWVQGNNNDGDIDEMEETEDQKKKKKKKFKYENDQNVNVVLKSGDAATRTTTKKVIDFDTFKEIVLTDEFITTFRLALIKSYGDKKIIYNNILKKLKSVQPKGSMFEMDSNHTRTEKQIAEVNKILSLIDVRSKLINKQKIRKDFQDIINNESNGFASLVGRKEVKDILSQRIYTFAKNPSVFIKGFQNIAIYGSSGVGKTKLAETIGYVYAKTGILIRRKFRKASKQEFTSPYIDESASLTRGVVMSCLEGVLFIDEAYGLTPGGLNMMGGNNHKDEAITELVNALDLYRGLGVVIVGGYENKMENNFMKSNEGMKRRFPTILRLGNYSSEQLTDILIDFIGDFAPTMEVEKKDANYLFKIVSALDEKKIFKKQAGDMQNMATEIVNAVYGSYLTWGLLEEDNREIIKAGVNRFLKNKGIKLAI